MRVRGREEEEEEEREEVISRDNIYNSTCSFKMKETTKNDKTKTFSPNTFTIQSLFN